MSETLLQKARAADGGRRNRPVGPPSDQEIELALAYFDQQLSNHQVNDALERKVNAYNWACGIVGRAIASEKWKIVQSDGADCSECNCNCKRRTG